MKTFYTEYKGPINFLAGFIVTLGVLAFFNSVHGTTNPEATMVYKACMSSRFENNGASEQKCGDMQDYYKYEFLCEDITPEAGCWVEKNDNLGDR